MQMIDADKRNVSRQRKGFSKRNPDKQTAQKPGTARHGNPVDMLQAFSTFLQKSVKKRTDKPRMFS